MAKTAPPRVLLVEDEPAQRAVLAYNLEAEGFDVIQADNGEDALLLVAEEAPDIIILDWMMPKLSGIEVCRRLKMRPETRGIPIIMLSARAEEVDRIRGLETGADDYVVKPYSVLELMARARAQLRRVRPSTAGVMLEYEDIRLDPESHRAYRSEKVLKLGPTEFKLLVTLMERPGRSSAASSFWIWSRASSVLPSKMRRNWREIGSAITGGGSAVLLASSSISWLIPTSASLTEIGRPSST